MEFSYCACNAKASKRHETWLEKQNSAAAICGVAMKFANECGKKSVTTLLTPDSFSHKKTYKCNIRNVYKRLFWCQPNCQRNARKFYAFSWFVFSKEVASVKGSLVLLLRSALYMAFELLFLCSERKIRKIRQKKISLESTAEGMPIKDFCTDSKKQ